MGLGGIYVALSMYEEFTRFETEGGMIVMHRAFLGLYNIGGKWFPILAILGISGAMAIYCVWGGLYELRLRHKKLKKQ
jgi:hypothetical protein